MPWALFFFPMTPIPAATTLTTVISSLCFRTNLPTGLLSNVAPSKSILPFVGRAVYKNFTRIDTHSLQYAGAFGCT